MSNQTGKNQEKSIEKLNDFFPLPNPSSSDIEKTFEEMGKTIVKEMGDDGKTPKTQTENSERKK